MTIEEVLAEFADRPKEQPLAAAWWRLTAIVECQPFLGYVTAGLVPPNGRRDCLKSYFGGKALIQGGRQCS